MQPAAGGAPPAAGGTPSALLRFEPFATVISGAFWSGLARLKLDRLGLDDAPLAIWGSFRYGRPEGTPNARARFHITEECLDSLACGDGKDGEGVGGEDGDGRDGDGEDGDGRDVDCKDGKGEGAARSSLDAIRIFGTLHLKNTLEEYAATDRAALLNVAAREVLRRAPPPCAH